MKTAHRLLLLPVLTLLAFASGARGQATSTAYNNFAHLENLARPINGAADGGSTLLLADDLTYGAASVGLNVSAFQVEIANLSGSTLSVTPTVIFWNADGASGGPGTLLGSYTLPLATLGSASSGLLSYTVPAALQFALPANPDGTTPGGTVWAGLYVTGTAGESGADISKIAIQHADPPAVGASADRDFYSSGPGPAAVSNPAGTMESSPFAGNPVVNYAWALTTVAPGTAEVLQNFPASAVTGAGPVGALLLAADGNYYGTTLAEGASADGTIFQLTPGGTVHTIYEFSGADGAGPQAALIQGNDGLLYGTTFAGGANGNGAIFNIPTGSTTQALKVLHSFGPSNPGNPNADGISPSGALIQARDGNFYGVARNGGASGNGTVFRITPAGAFTLLASFGSDAAAPAHPTGALIEDANGNLVGTTRNGGTNGQGAIYQLTLAGSVTTLDSVTAANSLPTDQLVLGADGNFYGVSLTGGAAADGTVFVVPPGVNGTLTTLASIGQDTQNIQPSGSLIMASDGNFYGADFNPSRGIYGVTPGLGGTLDFEHILDNSFGDIPTPVIQGSDGNFYGATGAGGTGSNGTIYRLNSALPPVVQFSQSEYAVNEFAGTATIRVDRIGGTGAISVNYVTEDGLPSPFADDVSATAGTDYQSTSGTLSWAAGDQTPKFFTVPIIDEGATAGGLRTLTMQLNSTSGSVSLGFPNTATLTINDSVQYAPKIISAKTASAQQGVAFSYQIAGTNHPASFSVSGLTDGFTVNAKTGSITGKPTSPGMLDLTLHAANAIGAGSAPLTITIAGPSSNASLYGLALSAGTLTPAFSSTHGGYAASVGHATTSITVTPTLADARATVKVDGVTVASGSASGAIALSVGANAIKMVTTAQNGASTATYTVTVTRAPSSNAALSSLTLSAGTLTPAFSSAHGGYTASVPNATSSVTVTPTLADATATVKVDGAAVTSGKASGAIALSVGANKISVATTAQDGVTKVTYTVTVTRAPSSNAALSSLRLSAGTLTPAFSSAHGGYTASVPNATTSITVTPTLADPAATVKVNGSAVASGKASGAIALSVGANKISVVTTAQNGTTTATYTVTVTRPPSSNAALSGLSLSAGTLTPAFSSTHGVYTASVGNATSSITVTPTLADATATVKINGVTVKSGSASAPIALSVGANSIKVVTTAQNGTSTATYTVTVTRPPSSNAALSSLSLSAGTLTPAFSSTHGVYTASVPNATSSITVTATLADPTATVKVNGTAAASGKPSGAIALSAGSNKITVVSTAQDGLTTATYTVTVTRAAAAPSAMHPDLAVSERSEKAASRSGAGTRPATPPIDDAFANQSGIYCGIFDGAEGFLTLDLTRSGQFTARLIFEEAEHAFSGAFDARGRYTGSIGEAKIAVDLQIVSNGKATGAGGCVLTGTVDGVALTALHAAYRRGQQAIEAGEYAIVFQATKADAATPLAGGYAVLRVSAGGEARYSGRLADGSGFTGSGTLLAGSDGTQLDIYAPVTSALSAPGAGKGLLAGTLTFEKLAGSALEGTLEWVQPLQGSGSTGTALEAVGSPDVAPVQGGSARP